MTPITIERMAIKARMDVLKRISKPEKGVEWQGNTRLVLEHSSLSLETANQAAFMVAAIQLDESQPATGAWQVNTAKLTEIISSITTPEVKLELNDTHLVIKHGRSKALLAHTTQMNGFPNRPVKDSFVGRFHSHDFYPVINQVANAASRDTNKITDGVSLSFNNDDNMLTCYGCNGVRMARGRMRGEIHNKYSAIIPAKSFLDVIGILKSIKDNLDVSVYSGLSYVMLEMGMLEAYVRPMSGAYPNCERVFAGADAKSNVFQLLNTQQVNECLRRAGITTNESNMVRLQFTPQGTTITASDHNNNQTVEFCPTDESKSTQDGEFYINHEHLSSILNSMDAESVDLRHGGFKDAVWLSAKDAAVDHLIMPINPEVMGK